jgi:phosphopantothenoylcysteine decarboxylase/phosphopantothenate--cysteine ligase
MAAAAWDAAQDAEVAIMAAAVADFRPSAPADGKLRRADGPPELLLEPTEDGLAGVRKRAPKALLVGFAAQVGDIEGAVAKSDAKDVDLLVANDITTPGAGFGSDDNEVTLVFRDGTTRAHALLPKSEVAARILDAVAELRP